MRQHQRPRAMVLLACLTCSFSFLRANAPSEPIVGTWQLSGMGDTDGNVARPTRLVIDIKASGRYEYRVWDEEQADPFELTGDWTLKGDLLTLSPRNAEALKVTEHVYRITWDARTLVLHSVEDGERDDPPMRFANSVGPR